MLSLNIRRVVMWKMNQACFLWLRKLRPTTNGFRLSEKILWLNIRKKHSCSKSYSTVVCAAPKGGGFSFLPGLLNRGWVTIFQGCFNCRFCASLGDWIQPPSGSLPALQCYDSKTWTTYASHL